MKEERRENTKSSSLSHLNCETHWNLLLLQLQLCWQHPPMADCSRFMAWRVTKKKKQHLIKMNFSIFLPSVQCVGTVQSPEHAWHSYLQTCLKINYRCKWKNADVSGFLHPSLYTTLACETLCSTSLLNALGADPRKLITLVSFLCMSWTSMIPPLQWGNQKRSGTFVCIYK